MYDVGKVVSPVEEFSGNRFQPFFRTFISHYVAYLGQSYQHAGPVFVAQPAFHVVFRK